MRKPSFPKNNPFKDALSTLKEDLVAKRELRGITKSENIQNARSVRAKISVSGSLNQKSIHDLSAPFKLSDREAKDACKNDLDRQSNSRQKNRRRNEVAIEALRNPLDRLVNDPSTKPIYIRKVSNELIQNPPPTNQRLLNSPKPTELLQVTSIPDTADTF